MSAVYICRMLLYIKLTAFRFTIQNLRLLKVSESHSKISNRMFAELFYARMLKMNRRSFTQEVLGVYASPFLDTDKLKMALRTREVSRALEKPTQ